MKNKIDIFTEQASEVTASLIKAPFKFAGGVLNKLFWWV